MKKYSWILFAAIFLSASSCGNGDNAEKDSTEHNHEGHDHDHDHEHDHDHDTTDQKSASTGAAIDPVCKMEKTADWTEFSVKDSDTTWFCSPHCKESFAKNPEKFLKAEPSKS